MYVCMVIFLGKKSLGSRIDWVGNDERAWGEGLHDVQTKPGLGEEKRKEGNWHRISTLVSWEDFSFFRLM